MSEELKHKLFDTTDCISEQTMFDYIDNRLSPKECHLVEKHLLDCELCSDALEGLRMLKDRGRISFAKNEITKKVFPIEKKETKIILFNYRVITGIAAALVLLIGAVFYFQQFTKKDAEQKEVALNKPESKTDTIPVTTSNAITTEPSTTESKPDELQQKTAHEEQSEKKKEMKFTATSQGSVNTIQQSNGASGYTVNANKTTSYKNNLAANGAQTGKDRSGDLAAKADQDNQEVVLLEQDKKVTDESKVSSQISYTTVSKNATAERPAPAFKKENKNLEYAKVANEKEGKKNEESNYRAIGGVTKEDIPAKQTKAKADKAPEVVAAPQSANDATIANNDYYDYENANTTRETIVTDSLSVQKSDTDAAQYPGGTVALVDFIRKNFNYNLSPYDSTHSIKTKIIVEFTVLADGTITDKKIKQGINLEINAEALRVVSIMPKWIPKVSGGKNVSSKMTIPFMLEVK